MGETPVGQALAGQVAVVTGASQGLGLAIAKRLLEGGANVSLWDRDETALRKAADVLLHPDRVHIALADVTSQDMIAAARDATVAHFGAVSILVNNAGISGPHGPLWELSLDEWLRVMDVNLTGVFLCCRAFAPSMIEADYGRIVNIASVAGKEPSPSISAYSTSKAGVIGLTKTLGRELANTKITVNCIAPAAIRTAIFDLWPEDYVKSLLAKIPMGRFGTPEELAELVAWVASPQASFSTGAVFDLSGGRADY